MTEMVIGLAIAIPLIVLGIPPFWYAMSKLLNARPVALVWSYINRWYDYWAERQVSESD